MKTKTISGHYGQTYSLAHNNREFIPNNVDSSRIPWNYNCVVAGGTVPYELSDIHFLNDYWKRYHELNRIYWEDRALIKKEEYERFQRELQRLCQRRPYGIMEDGGVFGLMLGVLFLPLIIAGDIYKEKKYAEAVERWESFKWEQHLVDLDFLAEKNSLRESLYRYDLQAGTALLDQMDGLVKEMATIADDIVNASDRYTLAPAEPQRFATLDEIYDKVFEPSFRAFQEKQRPCRRYDGTYLEYIRAGQLQEVKKKQINKNNRNHKHAEAFEIVFCIGDMDNTGYENAFADAKRSESLLKDFCDHLLEQKNVCFVTSKELDTPGWQPPFNNGLIILNMNVHCDEATPGIHLTCIPYTRNCKRGPAVQPSMGRALAGMGYPTTWKNVLDENGEPIPKRDRNGDTIYNKDGSVHYKQEPDKQGVLDWIEEQKVWLQKEMKERYDWDREYKGSHSRGNLSTPDYKAARAEERRQEIERQIDTMMQNFIEHIDDQIDRLDESVDKVWREADDWEKILKYLNACPQDEFDNLYMRAARYLDRLPEHEYEKAHQALHVLIQKADAKHNNQAPGSHKKSQKEDLWVK